MKYNISWEFVRETEAQIKEHFLCARRLKAEHCFERAQKHEEMALRLLEISENASTILLNNKSTWPPF